MSTQTLPAAIDVPRQTLDSYCRRNDIQELALFGSALRSDFREDSDLDLLVTFRAGARIGFLALARIQRELSELLRRPVDLVPKDGLKDLLRERVLAEARPLYAA